MFLEFIIERINTVAIKVQNVVENNVLKVIELYDSLIDVFEKSLSEFDQFEKDVKAFILFENSGYEKDRVRQKKRKLQADEELSGRDHFKVTIFLICIDSLLSEL